MTINDDDFVKQLRDRLAEMPQEPVPPEAMKRWRGALDAAARSETRVRPVTVGLRFAAAAAVVLVGVGVAVLAYLEGAGTAAEGPLAQARVERGLQLHLLELESQLARVAELPGTERASTVRQLAQQNRLQTAVLERAGEVREARVLRAFTLALDEIAADAAANGKVHAALAQLDFEMKVTQARLASSFLSASALRSQAL